MMLELDRESPLFESVLPVRLSSLETDEGERALTVRLVWGSRVAAGHSTLETQPMSSGALSRGASSATKGGDAAPQQRGRERVLHLELCDANDPYFLYGLDVGESDFHELRRQHCLLVDFSSFPSHFIALLDKCGEASMPRFSVALEKTQGELAVVESNAFKQVTHLALTLRKGDDATVKAYLAGRLDQVARRAEASAASLEDRTAALRIAEARVAELDKRLSEAAAASGAVAARAEAERLEEAARLREQHTVAVEAARREHAAALEREREARTAEAHDASSQVAQLSQSLASERSARARAEVVQQDLERRCAGLSERLEAAEAEASSERDSRKAAQADRDRAETAKHAAEVRLAAASQRADDAQAAIARADDLRRAADEARKAGDEALDRLEAAAKKREEQLKQAAAEIRRGNAIIEKLADQARGGAAKIKLQADLVKQLERRLDEADRDRDDHKHKCELAQAEAARHRDARVALERDLDDCRAKLKEAAELIDNNQQVIQYLNAELNEHQLGRRDFYHNVVSPPRDDYRPPKRTRDRLATAHKRAPAAEKPEQQPLDARSRFHVAPVPANDREDEEAEENDSRERASNDPAAAYFERYANDDSLASINDDTLGFSSTATPPNADLPRARRSAQAPAAADAGFY